MVGMTVSASAAVGSLVYVAHEVDDDNSGQSSGNADGFINCGESIELWVALYNQGANAATEISATISSTDPYITFTYNITSTYLDTSGFGIKVNSDDFSFDVDPNAPHTRYINLGLDIVASNGGPWHEDFYVYVDCATDWIYLPIVLRNN